MCIQTLSVRFVNICTCIILERAPESCSDILLKLLLFVLYCLEFKYKDKEMQHLPGGVIRAWHTPQRHKSAGEYGCVRKKHIGELCKSGSPKHYLRSQGVTMYTHM